MTKDEIVKIILADKSTIALSESIDSSVLNELVLELESNCLIKISGSPYREPREQTISLTKKGNDFKYLQKT
ncbi:hypothetical protein, partial [Emticicia aquatica]|uniref:hypothetical protein n=1 Tax=Emticicia aquatica TaxID=1681835 RepID=UPI001EE9C9AD